MAHNGEEKSNKIKKYIKVISLVLLSIVIIWFSLMLVELYRVKSDKRPIICVNQIKDVEDDDEYSITCYGILYKYREYHYNIDDAISAREFTMVFKDFERKLGETE